MAYGTRRASLAHHGDLLTWESADPTMPWLIGSGQFPTQPTGF